ncbi:hypothetical protein [Microcoleus sp. herbarium12]
MNSLLLTSTPKGSGFQPILSGKTPPHNLIYKNLTIPILQLYQNFF